MRPSLLLFLFATPLCAALVTIDARTTASYFATNPDYAANPLFPLHGGSYEGSLAVVPSPFFAPGLSFDFTDAATDLPFNFDSHVFAENGMLFTLLGATLPETPGQRFVFKVQNLDPIPHDMDLNPDFFGLNPVVAVPEPSYLAPMIVAVVILTAWRPRRPQGALVTSLAHPCNPSPGLPVKPVSPA